MTLPRTTIRALLLLAASAVAATAQTPSVSTAVKSTRKQKRARPPRPQYNPNVILLDPAHGGTDSGADLGPAGLEKDWTVAFADRLRALLAAQGFTVVLTHVDASADTSPDQRAEIANRSRAVACLLLHATDSGHGIHLFASALTEPPPGQSFPENYIAPWDSAQATSLPKSLELASEISTALNGLRAPLVLTRATVKPIDSFACPALAIEIAPPPGGSSVADDAYRERVAESLATALSYWRDHAKAQITAQNDAFQAAQATAAFQTAPAQPAKPKPKPRLVVPPEESPLAPANPPGGAPR